MGGSLILVSFKGGIISEVLAISWSSSHYYLSIFLEVSKSVLYREAVYPFGVGPSLLQSHPLTCHLILNMGKTHWERKWVQIYICPSQKVFCVYCVSRG